MASFDVVNIVPLEYMIKAYIIGVLCVILVSPVRPLLLVAPDKNET